MLRKTNSFRTRELAPDIWAGLVTVIYYLHSTSGPLTVTTVTRDSEHTVGATG